MKRILSTLTFSLFLAATLLGQGEWIVPDDQKGKLSDFGFTQETVESGSALYLTNCRSCHGMPGQGNYINLTPSPGDPATDKIQHNSDGELYYKLREGRGQMPSFKKVLSVQEIWEIVSYLRSFNPDYVQQIAIAASNNRWSDILMQITLLEADRKIQVQVTGMEESNRTPVTGAAIRMEVERRFGNLMLGEPVLTNDNGSAWFDAPYDLPGDPEGNLRIFAQLDDEEEFGLVKTDTLVRAGKATTTVSLTANRAMWNTMKKAPIWLLMTYGLGVLAVWGLIFYTLLLLRGIFKEGEKSEPNIPS